MVGGVVGIQLQMAFAGTVGGNSLQSGNTARQPGPLQLFWRNKRFEPEGGFEALFT